MSVLTCGELFCGGGGWIANLLDVLTPLWAIDNDTAVVSAYHRNLGNHVICADVTEVDARTLPPVDVLFASPPCQQWSLVRSKRSPTRCDAEVGTVVCRYIEVLQPSFVFIENVRGYAQSQSLQAIMDTLYNESYWFDVALVDAAHWGVPQHRERLILRAVRHGAVPHLPPRLPYIGWYSAICDLVPTFQESGLTLKQRSQLLPTELDSTLLIERVGARSGRYQKRRPEQPIWTIRCAITTDQRGNNRSRFIDLIHRRQVLQLNTRALARFQSFPDWYVLPDVISIAGRIIGNAVPPAMARSLVLNTVFE